MLKADIEIVREIARQIAKEEIALALVASKPVTKVEEPETAEKESDAEVSSEEVDE
jgi:hypothetical protein